MGLVRTSARVARFLAGQRTGLARWRRGTVTVAGLLLALAVGLAISLASAASLRQEVFRSRQPIVEPGPGPRLRMLEYGPVVEGRQLPIYWVDAAASDAPVPPGLDRLPAPGTVVVSPGLARLGGADLEAELGLPLAVADGEPVLIGASGLAGSEELLAYARPPEGRRIDSERTVDVRGFGRAAPSTPIGAGYEPDGPTGLALGAVALGVVPALYLLWVAVGAGVGPRDARLRILHDLGASRRALGLTAFLEGLLQAAPGVVIGSALWALVVARGAGVPRAGIGFFAGDLRVGWPWAIAVAVSGALVAGTMAAVQATGRWHPVPERSAPTRAVSTIGRRLRIGALVVVVGLLVASHLSRYPSSSQYWYLAFLVAVVAQPLALPVCVEAVGRRVARRPDPLWWLAGARLAHSPGRLSRPAFALVGLVFVGAVGTAAAAVVWTGNAAPGADPPVVSLGWNDPRPDDVASLRRALPEATVLTVRTDPDGATTLIVPTCADLVALVAAPSCDRRALVRAEQRLDDVTAGGPIGGSLLVGPDASGPAGEPASEVVIVGPEGRTGRQLYADALPVAHRELGMANLNGGRFLQFSETSRRAGAGVAVAATVLLLSALVLMGDRSLLLAREDDALALVGASAADQRRVRYLQVAVPAVVATITGGLMAVAFVWVGAEVDTKPETVFLWLPILVEVGVVAALALALAVVVSRVRPAPGPSP